MYRWYQVVVALLKFDVFFGLAFAVQYVILQLTINEPEFWATVIAMPISLVIVLLGIYGIRKEDRIVTASFVAGILCAIAYFIFKIVRMFDATEHSKYEFTWKYLVFFGRYSEMCRRDAGN